MHILIVSRGVLPPYKYGGTERVIWYLGQRLTTMGHKVSYLLSAGASCPFAEQVLVLNEEIPLEEQLPDGIDLVHLHFTPKVLNLNIPYVITIHGIRNTLDPFDRNSIFVAKNTAARYGSTRYVYNGLNWEDYGPVDLQAKRTHFHFLAKAAWRLKNVKGAISLVNSIKGAKLKILGGHRLNFNMGFRFTWSLKAHFYGMVDGPKKIQLLQGSKGLIFPVLAAESFGLALIESLYFGCPVFGTPYGSLPELITKEVGYLSNVKAELREAMLAADSYDKKVCHEYARDNFNADKMAQNYLIYYQEVLNGHALHEKEPVLQQLPTGKLLPWK